MDIFKNEDAADILVAKLKESGVKYGLASFVDLHGIPKAKAVPIAHLHQMLGGSEMFTGAALDGVPQGDSLWPDLAVESRGGLVCQRSLS